jgi:arylsulfatase
MNKYLLFLFLVTFNYQNSYSQEDPNIVIILLDDMGYGDIESFGAIDYQTPNINNLADNGMLFTNFYSAQAVCSASRAGLLTGTYPNRIGIHGALFPQSKVGLNTSEKTIAEILKEKNYKTAVIGKWHLGYQKEFLPLNHGFDYYYGIPYSNDMWPVDFDGNQIKNDNDWRKKNYPQLPIIENFNKVAEVRTLEDQAELTTTYTKKSVEFINKNADKPFFLYVPHSMPHVPIAASKKFKGKSKQGLYGDVIMELDWSLGEIVKALRKNGILENTMIIFTSDNGPWLNFGNHAGNTAGLREGKGTVFEGGQRVPTIISWPKAIKKSTISNKLAASIDILPTITKIVKGKLPNHKIDGVSILDILKGKNTTARDHFFYYYKTNSLEAVRKDHWKLILPHESRSYENVMPGMDGYNGNYSKLKLDYELYDLRRDPGERYNVIKKYPEIAQSLKDLAETAIDDMGDNATGRKGKNTREPGRVN